MTIVTDIRDAVAAEKTVIQGVVTLLGQLHQQLADALAVGDVATAQQILADVKANTDTLSQAVQANTDTPPAP